MAWVLLSIAIAAEIVGTLCLKASDGLSKLLPSIGVLFGYATAFTLMAMSLKKLDVGITYEEANFIKETFAKQYDLREITLMPSKKEEHTQDWNKGVDIQVENVDTIVLSQLESVQSDTIKKQILVDIYTGLTT